jgi:hypothetical protein
LAIQNARSASTLRAREAKGFSFTHIAPCLREKRGLRMEKTTQIRSGITIS